MVEVYFTTYHMTLAQIERFWQKVPSERANGTCWLWQGRIGQNGYGYFDVGPKRAWRSALAHVLCYELLIGSVPEGLELDHLCRTPLCINPSHLEPVTHQENIRRAYAILRPLGAVFCTKGHLLTAETVYVGGKRRVRQCKQCAKDRAMRRTKVLYATDPEWKAARLLYAKQVYQRRKKERENASKPKSDASA